MRASGSRFFWVGPGPGRDLVVSFLDISLLFVQQRRNALDVSKSDRYISDHMTLVIHKEISMSRFRWVAIGILLVLAVTAAAQESGARKHDDARTAGQHAAPSVDALVKTLTEKLDLTTDQQAKIRDVLQNLHEFTKKLADDPSLTEEERTAKAKPERMKAHQQMMAILTEDQKKKAAEYLKGPHREMHDFQ
jgi:Spy/CpxP family protein refolding chaperone